MHKLCFHSCDTSSRQSPISVLGLFKQFIHSVTEKLLEKLVIYVQGIFYILGDRIKFIYNSTHFHPRISSALCSKVGIE